ncbi:L-ribulose-5-phosphate 3-epimerase [Spiroplasma endosymbiont of Aspidapion aeneum]|uniref:L-ribulose-5-phosphate 3-epimerase n=1 Tax=Spiroplasma endosymbiont of Aspidapion aeneum TaxID=3066276 RepID=UPI00313B57EC
MKILKNNLFGIYEKALPPGDLEEKIIYASNAKFDFLEMSIDESDKRLMRLNMDDKYIEKILSICKNNNIFIRSICFSAQRRYPLGSHNENIRKQSIEMLKQCILLAFKLNIRIIQIAGYDVFYEEKDDNTKKWFIEGLNEGLWFANIYGVNLSIEIMDDPFINSITKYLELKKRCQSPWLSVYPDLGNLSAWNKKNTIIELEKGFGEIVALHIKDTLEVKDDFKGKFKNVNFGEGCVDFKKIFKYLKDKKYSGSFLIEAWYEDFPDPTNNLDKSKKFITDIFRETGWELC